MLSDGEGAIREAVPMTMAISTMAQPIRTNIKATPPTPPERNLRDLLNVYLTDPTRRRSKKTEITYENVLAVVGEVLGLDTPLKAIDRESCRRLLDTLRWLPTNHSKRFPKLTPVQAASMAKARVLRSTLSPLSINGYMNRLSTLMNFALNEGYIDRNPAKGLRVPDPTHRRDKRRPFSTEQLQTIFNAPLYAGCQDDEYGYAERGTARPRRGRFWVPLIALHAGLRLNEICQLDLADIRVVEGVNCFWITSRSSHGVTDKRIKTASSERLVPIHPTLLNDLDFMSFVDERRRNGGRKLFPELPVSASTGYYSDPFSKWFKRFIEKAGAASPKTCFHSFRHNFRDGLREARIDHDVALALGGWANAGGREGVETAENYGGGFRVQTLASALSEVRYPQLDLSHLRP